MDSAILDELIQATQEEVRQKGDVDVFQYAEARGVSVTVARRWLKKDALKAGLETRLVYDPIRQRKVRIWRRKDQ